MAKKILIAGESWTSVTTHIKGADTFIISVYAEGADYLREALKSNGYEITYRLGTFRPVKTSDIREHVIHDEYCEVPQDTVEAVEACRRRGGRVIAAGTTVARTLESMACKEGGVRAGHEDTRLFIYPGFEFRVVDALITNRSDRSRYHRPRLLQ